jgi:homoserine dehydrogenase
MKQRWVSLAILFEVRCNGIGAGLPIISTLKDMVLTGDRVIRIEGVFSGTLSYLFNEYSTVTDPTQPPVSRKFSEIVKKAKELGYTVSFPFHSVIVILLRMQKLL